MAANLEPECRILSPADAQQLLNVAPDVFDHEIDAQLVAEFLSDCRHHLVVGVVSGQVVGFVSAVHYVHPDKPAEMWINEVGVAPAHRGRGLGRRMLQTILTLAREIGCVNAWVLTDEANEVATRLYHSVGGNESKAVMFEFSLYTNAT